MTKIKFRGWTFVGTAEGDHGVFTHSLGRVFAGQIARGYPRVGVLTSVDGTTHFVECDADGQEHGRWLACFADGDTVYRRYEHGNRVKEHADLLANGKCFYEKGGCFTCLLYCKGKKCSADYPPFAALQAMVLPIKARHSRPIPAFAPRAPRPPIGASATAFALAGAGNDARRQGARPPPPTSPQQLQNKRTARPTGTTHRAEGCTTHATQTTCVVHPSASRARRARAVDPHVPPPFPSCATRRFGALRLAAGCNTRLYNPRASRTPPMRVAVAFRAAHLHSGPIARTKFRSACDAPIIARGDFRPFRIPPKSGWGLALAGLCSSAAWFGRPRRRWPRRRRPKRRRRSLPPHTGWMRSPSHCERHILMR
jgi:hypothetical protein